MEWTQKGLSPESSRTENNKREDSKKFFVFKEIDGFFDWIGYVGWEHFSVLLQRIGKNSRCADAHKENKATEKAKHLLVS